MNVGISMFFYNSYNFFLIYLIGKQRDIFKAPSKSIYKDAKRPELV